MTIEELQTICNQLSGVTQDIKWEDHLSFNIGGKMFLVTSPDSVPISASFKVLEEEYEEVLSKEGFYFNVYLGRYKWVSLDDINRLSGKQWEYYIRKSYELIASKLPVKVKKQIGLIK